MRRPSALVAYAQVGGGWTEIGRQTFSEAGAVWTGDRFVIASNQVGSADVPDDAATTFVPGASSAESRWQMIDPSGVGSCEGPIEVTGDGTGGVVVWSCGRAAFLSAGARSWRKLPDHPVGGTASLSPIGAFDGIVVSMQRGPGSEPSRLWAIDLRKTADARTFRPCPRAAHLFERPPPPDESGDGLPKSGTATRAAAVRGEPDAFVRYGATKSEIVEVDGRAWRRDATGAVEIVPERLTVLRLTLASSHDCPDAPVFAGAPVVFQYPTR
jgi:hypothetical protein